MIEQQTIEQALLFLETAFEVDTAMPPDSLIWVQMVETAEEYNATVGIGMRARMRSALIEDGILTARAVDLTGRPAPDGFVWVVIDWGKEVTTLLYKPGRPSRTVH